MRLEQNQEKQQDFLSEYGLEEQEGFGHKQMKSQKVKAEGQKISCQLGFKFNLK